MKGVQRLQNTNKKLISHSPEVGSTNIALDLVLRE